MRLDLELISVPCARKGDELVRHFGFVGFGTWEQLHSALYGVGSLGWGEERGDQQHNCELTFQNQSGHFDKSMKMELFMRGALGQRRILIISEYSFCLSLQAYRRGSR